MLSWERASAFWFTAVCISRDSSFSIQCVAWALACISCYPGIQRQVQSMEQKLRHKNIWSGKVKCIEVFKTWLNKSGRNQVVDSPKTGPPNAGLLCTSFFVPRFVIESSTSSIKCVFQCWLKLIFPLFPTPTESSSQSICPASPLQMRTSSHLPRLVRDRLLKHLGESRTLNSCPSALAKIVLQANSWGVCSGFHWWADAFGEAQRSTKHRPWELHEPARTLNWCLPGSSSSTLCSPGKGYSHCACKKYCQK